LPFACSVRSKRAGRRALKLLVRSARLLRCLVAQRGVRPDRVVVVVPQVEPPPCIIPAVEYLLVQKLVPQAAVEAFDKGILGRFSGCELMPVKLATIHELQDRPTGELDPWYVGNDAPLKVMAACAAHKLRSRRPRQRFADRPSSRYIRSSVPQGKRSPGSFSDPAPTWVMFTSLRSSRR
jgi:hypothetical protein